eukprot:GHVR01134327.1.p1 GENE.GHVR01134327.1~~GHVR01134327.1.p1  ORF type:complete len:100 (+),score=4.33 GHVR01134327.1:1161-1460(+)
MFIDMSRLRDITIYLIETIHQWKMQTEEYSDRCGQYSPIFFIHDNENFYLTLQKDTLFIWKSRLNEYIWLEYKNDPLIIRNVAQVDQREHKQVLEKYFV